MGLRSRRPYVDLPLMHSSTSRARRMTWLAAHVSPTPALLSEIALVVVRLCSKEGYLTGLSSEGLSHRWLWLLKI